MTFKEKIFYGLSAVTATTATCTAVEGINDHFELTTEDRAALDDVFEREQAQRGFVEDLIRASDRFFTNNPDAPSAERLIADNEKINAQLREFYKRDRIGGGLIGADAIATPGLFPVILVNRNTPLVTGTIVHEMDHITYGIHSPTYVLEVVNVIKASMQDSSTPALGEAIIRQGDIPYFVGMQYTVADLPHALFGALQTDMFPGSFSDAEVEHFYERFSSLPPDQWNKAMANFVTEMPLFGGMVEAFGVTNAELLECYEQHPEYQEASRETARRDYEEWSKEHPREKPEAKHSLDKILKNFR